MTVLAHNCILRVDRAYIISERSNFIRACYSAKNISRRDTNDSFLLVL